jgi:hypothetical protein
MNVLQDYLRIELGRPVQAAVLALAQRVVETQPGVAAILAYGSTLRDTDVADTLIDLYVIVDHPRDISTNLVSRIFAGLVPPNVYYAEHVQDGQNLRCKYAVVTFEKLQQKLGINTSNPYFWARFSQPMRLVFVRDETAKVDIITAIATAIHTALSHAPQHGTSLERWAALFEETYQTELRPEGKSRARDIVAQYQDYYDTITADAGPVPMLDPNWGRIRIAGKALTLARLAKAAFTFQGGADYLAWKISRHTGKPVAVSPWQRKHPLIAGLLLLPKLWRSGQVR